jgi:nucleotide-binding universal stress UspA family protein
MNILLAVDGSKYGRWATEWIARLPLVSPPRLTALHVMDVAALRAPFVVQPVIAGNERFIQEEIKRLEMRANKTVEETRSLFSIHGLKGKVVSQKGSVAATILKQSPKRDGLVVVGSRGLDALDRFMLGSVSTQVTLHAPCSVLVVKDEARPVRRIVFATDGSPSSEKAIRFLTSKLRADAGVPAGAVEPILVAIVHVMPFLKYPELKEAGKKVVERCADKLIKAGYQVEEVLRLGKPAEEIMKVASRKKADLIVTGAKGLGAIARFLLGSVSTKVVQHSSCSVLVVR